MLKSLNLTNFKRHQALALNFSSGLTCLCGDNGAGKSTVLRAIVYVLFGAAAAGKREHLTTWENGQAMSVSLSLVLPTVGEVEVKRSLNSATVTRGDELLASGQEPVTQYIETALGLKAKDFRLLFYAAQGETQALLKMGPVGLQRQLEAIANIKVVDTIMSAIRSDIAASTKWLDMAGLPDMEALSNQVDAANLALLTAETECAATDSEQQNCQQELTEQEDWLKNSLRPQVQAFRNCLSGFKILQSQWEKGESELLALVDPEPDLEGLEESCQKTTEEVAQINADIKAVYDCLSTLNKAKASVDLLKVSLNQKASFAELGEKWRAMQIKASELAGLRVEADQALRAADVPPPATECPECNRPFGDSPEEQAHLKAAYAAWEERKQQAEDRMAAVNAEINGFATTRSVFLRELKGITQKELDNYASWCASTQGAYDQACQTYEQALDAASEDFPYLRAHARDEYIQVLEAVKQPFQDALAISNTLLKVYQSRLEKKRDYDRQVASLQTVQRENLEAVRELESRLAAFPVGLEHTLEQTEAHLDQLRETHKTLCQAVVRNQAQLEAARLDLKRKQADFDKASKLAAEVESTEAMLALRKKLLSFLLENRTRFISDTWQSLTTYASGLLSSTTEGLISNLTRSESGEFTVDEEALAVPVDELSGARQSIVGLCIRIALGRLFYGDHGFLLLDEVTADCRDENAARVAGMLSGLNTQVLMVTHREGDAVNAANLITL